MTAPCSRRQRIVSTWSASAAAIRPCERAIAAVAMGDLRLDTSEIALATGVQEWLQGWIVAVGERDGGCYWHGEELPISAEEKRG